MDKKSAIRARRAHIVEAALECFLEKGYNQTGIRDIARRAEISLGNLYNYFPSKKAVLIEIAELDQEDVDYFVKQLSKQSKPEKTLRKFLADYAKYCGDPDYVTLSFEIIGEAIRDKEISELFIQNHEKLVDALAELLIAGQTQGVFREQQDYREVAQILLDAIDGYSERMVLGMRKPKGGNKIVLNFLLSSILLPSS